MIKNINELYDYIYSFINIEKGQKLNKKTKVIYSLDNIIKILKCFDNPQSNQKIIHITGTKGKGSVTLFISLMLRKLNYNVSTFMSPHLVDINERFLFNMKEITDDELIELTNQVREVLDENHLVPTTFELIFLIFLLFARRKKSDFLVVEVGLGGRLDTTNVVDPVLSVITPISFDHTNILGRNLKDIAFEKAGIIKRKTDVVVSRQKKIVRDIIVNKALESNSKLYDISEFFHISSYTSLHDGISFSFEFNKHLVKDFFLPLLGVHQIDNFFTSFLSVYLIDKSIVDVIYAERQFDIKIKARIEVLQKDPLIIVDVSHNKDSANKLKKALKDHFPDIKKWIVLSSLGQNKDYKGFYRELSEIAELIIITSQSKYKKSNPQHVFKKASEIFRNTILVVDQNEAFERAVSFNAPLLVTGSFYLAGPFLEKWKTKKLHIC